MTIQPSSFNEESQACTAADQRLDGTISVVLPVYNEAEVLRELHNAVQLELLSLGREFEIVFVNDGSTDRSPEVLDELADEGQHVRVVHLSRNFGHQAALHCGLEHSRGDAVIVMDSDMQDDPGAFRRFVRQWECGADVVYAQRTDRKESAPKRLLFWSFYRVLNLVAESPMPADAGNFGLLDRRVVRAVLQLSERDRYFPGIRSWVGFRQVGIPVERLQRHDNQPRVRLRGLIRLAKTALFAFSRFPLTFFYLISLASALTCVGVSAFVLYHKLFSHLAIPGWTSTMITASFFGAINALGISLLGEYVVRIYDQTRGRPLALVARVEESRSKDINRLPAEPALQVVDVVEDMLEELQRRLPRESRSRGPRGFASRTDTVIRGH